MKKHTLDLYCKTILWTVLQGSVLKYIFVSDKYNVPQYIINDVQIFSKLLLQASMNHIPLPLVTKQQANLNCCLLRSLSKVVCFYRIWHSLLLTEVKSGMLSKQNNLRDWNRTGQVNVVGLISEVISKSQGIRHAAIHPAWFIHCQCCQKFWAPRRGKQLANPQNWVWRRPLFVSVKKRPKVQIWAILWDFSIEKLPNTSIGRQNDAHNLN